MAIVRDAKGRQIQTRAGVQPKQYQEQLHKAGMLAPVLRARGLERVRLERAASTLVSYLRSGEVTPRSKICAAQLGLSLYPDGTKGIK